jgi:uncharacterized protein DUF2637
MTSTDTTTHAAAKRSATIKAAWPLVVGAALAISWWSLYTLAHGKYGMPVYLAAVVSTVYDGGALVLADLSQRYARSTDSGAGPRALMLTLIGASAWLNYEHAVMLSYSLPGKVMFASPPVVAGALFEIEQRFTHREALRAHGRVAPALPAFGRYAWLLHPARTVKRVWLITASRVDSVPLTVMDMYPRPALAGELVAEPAGEVEPEPEPAGASEDDAPLTDADLLLMSEPPAWSGMTAQAAIERADAILPGDQRTGPELVALLGSFGIKTTDSYVRTARRRIRERAEVGAAGEADGDAGPDATVYQIPRQPHAGAQSA